MCDTKASDVVSIEKKKHKWAAGGVSGYPLTHPIVGQTKFFNQFRHFIHLVDDESEKFAHVFAIIGQWGIGKSRLAYELMSQINDTSPGWYVRDAATDLAKRSSSTTTPTGTSISASTSATPKSRPNRTTSITGSAMVSTRPCCR